MLYFLRYPYKAVLSIYISIYMLLQPLSVSALGINPVRNNEFSINPSVASVTDSYNGSASGPVLFLIQDAHTNASAQLNISRLIEELIEDQGIHHVFMEAGQGDESIRFLRQDADESVLRRESLDYLRKGRLQGVEYANLAGKHDFTIWGVEDPDLYTESLETYRTLAEGRKEADHALTRISAALESLSNRILSKTVLELESKRKSYLKEEITFTDYAEFLSRMAVRAGISIKSYRHIRNVLKIRESEGQIDFTSVNSQYALLARMLEAQKVLKKIPESITEQQIGFWEKYALLNSDNIELSDFLNYLDHLKSVRTLKAEGAIQDLERLQEDVQLALSDRYEYSFLLLNRAFENTQAFLDIKSTPEIFNRVVSDIRSHHPERIAARVNQLLVKQGEFHEKILFQNKAVSEQFINALKFYFLTQHRDRHMIDNMMRFMSDHQVSKAAFIAGGFHTENIKNHLKQLNMSYTTLSPVIDHETDFSRYESLLLQQEIETEGASDSNLMRKRIQNQPKDWKSFLKSIRYGQAEIQSTAAARLSAVQELKSMDSKRKSGVRSDYKVLEQVNRLLEELTGRDLRFHEAVGDDLNPSLVEVENWASQAQPPEERNALVAGLMVIQEYYDNLGHRLRRAQKHHAYLTALDVLNAARRADPQNAEIRKDIAQTLFHLGRYDEAEAMFIEISEITETEGGSVSRSAAVGLANARLEMVRSKFEQFEGLFDGEYASLPGENARQSKTHRLNYDIQLASEEIMQMIDRSVSELFVIIRAYKSGDSTKISQIPRAYGILAALEAERSRLVRKLHETESGIDNAGKLPLIQYSIRSLSYAAEAIRVAARRGFADDASDRHTQSLYGRILGNLHRNLILVQNQPLTRNSFHRVDFHNRYERALKSLSENILDKDQAKFLTNRDLDIIRELREISEKLNAELNAYRSLQESLPDRLVSVLENEDFSNSTSGQILPGAEALLASDISQTDESDLLNDVNQFVSDEMNSLQMSSDQIIAITAYSHAVEDLTGEEILPDLDVITEWTEVIGYSIARSRVKDILNELKVLGFAVEFTDTSEDFPEPKKSTKVKSDAGDYDLGQILKKDGYLYTDHSLLDRQARRLARIKPWVSENEYKRLLQRAESIQADWEVFQNEAKTLQSSGKNLRDSAVERKRLTALRIGVNGKGGYYRSNEKLKRLLDNFESRAADEIIRDLTRLENAHRRVQSQANSLQLNLQILKAERLSAVLSKLSETKRAGSEEYLDYDVAEDLVQQAEMIVEGATIEDRHVQKASSVKQKIIRAGQLFEEVRAEMDGELVENIELRISQLNEEFENMAFGAEFESQLSDLDKQIQYILDRIEHMKNLIKHYMEIAESTRTHARAIQRNKAAVSELDGGSELVQSAVELGLQTTSELENLSNIPIKFDDSEAFEAELNRIDSASSAFAEYSLKSIQINLNKRKLVADEVQNLLKVMYKLLDDIETGIIPRYRGEDNSIRVFRGYRQMLEEAENDYLTAAVDANKTNKEVDEELIKLGQTAVHFVGVFRGLWGSELKVHIQEINEIFEIRLARAREKKSVFDSAITHLDQVDSMRAGFVIDPKGFPLEADFFLSKEGKSLPKSTIARVKKALGDEGLFRDSRIQKWRDFTGVQDLRVLDVVAAVGTLISSYTAESIHTTGIKVPPAYHMFERGTEMILKNFYTDVEWGSQPYRLTEDGLIANSEYVGSGFIEDQLNPLRVQEIAPYIQDALGIEEVPEKDELTDLVLVAIFQDDGARLSSDVQMKFDEIQTLYNSLSIADVTREERIEMLLAFLYGGQTSFVAKEGELYFNFNFNRKHGLRKLRSDLINETDNPLKDQVENLFSSVRSDLDELGIRDIIPQEDGSEFNIRDALSVDRYYFNPFLISFTGLPDYARGEDEGRYQKAIRTMSLNTKQRKQANRLFLNYRDVYHPSIEVDGNEIYSIRAKHNSLLGTPKGGVRYVAAWALMGDPIFKERFERLKHLGANQTELEYFLRRWVKQETLPLAVGMTIKTAASNSVEKESWWVEAFKSLFGHKTVHKMLGGAKGAILLARVNKDLELEEIFDHTENGMKGQYFATRAYANELYLSGRIGPDIDVPAPDVGVPPGAMDVATDEVLYLHFKKLYDEGKLQLWPDSLDILRDSIISLLELYPLASPDHTPLLDLISDYASGLESGEVQIDDVAYHVLQPTLELRSVFTAKSIDPVYKSGSQFRTEATGYGVVHVLDQVVRMSQDELETKFRELYPENKQLFSVENQPLQHMTAKIMGLGNVGYDSAVELINRGVKVQMISEGPKGIIRKESGFTIEDLKRLMELKKRYAGQPHFKFLNSDDHPDLKIPGAHVVDGDNPDDAFYNSHTNIFVLAAKENSITTRNVSSMNADIYIEGANGAISYAAYDVLEARGSLVIPDSLANAGGVIVSYFEMLQNRLNQRWPKRKVRMRLERYLKNAIKEINEYRVKYRTDWRTAIDIRTVEMLLDADRNTPQIAAARLAYQDVETWNQAGENLVITTSEGDLWFGIAEGDSYSFSLPLSESDQLDLQREIEVSDNSVFIPVISSSGSYLVLNSDGSVKYDRFGESLISVSIDDTGTGLELTKQEGADLTEFLYRSSNALPRITEKIIPYESRSGKFSRFTLDKKPSVNTAASRLSVTLNFLDGTVSLNRAEDDVQFNSAVDKELLYQDDLIALNRHRESVNQILENASDTKVTRQLPKVISLDLGIFEGGGLSDQVIFEAFLPAIAAEFESRNKLTDGNTVFYVQGPDRLILALNHLLGTDQQLLYSDKNPLPEKFRSEKVRKANLLRSDEKPAADKGLVIPVVAPVSKSGQVDLFPIAAILDFTEAVTDVFDPQTGELDSGLVQDMRLAYQALIRKPIDQNVFVDILKGKADIPTMTLFGIPSLSPIPIDRLIRVFAIGARMAAQSA